MNTLIVDDIKRCIGNYHSNMWDDAPIQSLSMSYGITGHPRNDLGIREYGTAYANPQPKLYGETR